MNRVVSQMQDIYISRSFPGILEQICMRLYMPQEQVNSITQIFIHRQVSDECEKILVSEKNRTNRKELVPKLYDLRRFIVLEGIIYS